MTEAARALWDPQAEDFDQEPDHGLRDVEVRRAWAQLLLPLLPGAGSSVLDVGCGTGSLSVLMAAAGHAVCAADLSAHMLRQARAKADHHGVRIGLVQADAARLPFAPGSFDVVVARHVLWAFEDPDAMVAGWVQWLRPAGSLLLIEGRWSTGAGLSPSDCLGLVRRRRGHVSFLLAQWSWPGSTGRVAARRLPVLLGGALSPLPRTPRRRSDRQPNNSPARAPPPISRPWRDEDATVVLPRL